MKGLNVRQESIKILEENISSNLFDISHSKFLLDVSPDTRETKAKNKWLGLHQNEKLLHSEGNSQQN